MTSQKSGLILSRSVKVIHIKSVFKGKGVRRKKKIEFIDWNLLERIIRKSDFLVELLDARNPLGTKNYRLDKLARKHNITHILAVNKIDLIPKNNAWLWEKYFRETGANVILLSARKRMGTLKLRKILRKICKEKKERCIGIIIGIPKTGKSTLINVLRGRHGASTSKYPGKPGYTKTYTIYRIERNIYIYDTPGLSPLTRDWLERTIRNKSPEDIEDPIRPAVEILHRTLKTNPDGIGSKYIFVRNLEDPMKMLEMIARKRGWLERKTGEPLIEEAARAIIRDYLDGKLNPLAYPPDMRGETRRKKP